MADFTGKNVLTRVLRLANNRTILLTEDGLTQMRKIVGTIDEADVFNGLVAYSDAWKAFRRILEDLISKGIRPDNGAELLQLMGDQLTAEISNHTYAIPLFGVDMEGIEIVTLGSMKIVRSPVPYLEVAGVKHEHADLPRILKATERYTWLIGSAKGTPWISQEKFREQAELVAGMLAVSAASMYERGAYRFRISLMMSPNEGYGRAVWLSWNDQNQMLKTHHRLSGSQQFKINNDLVEQFAADSLFSRAFEIFESGSKSQLEEAITKGFYWFSDAHRDPVPVMKLIKYWSCIETFFSADNKDITRSVSVGLAGVLVYGGFGFVPETEYLSLRKRVAELYGDRSRAVHGGVYHHVSERNVNDLSQWAAWMLINMISFVERGYTEISQIKAILDRLVEKFERRGIEICRFFGIIIRMFYDENDPPNFYAEYQGNKAVFNLNGNVIKGTSLSKTATRLIREWIDLRLSELKEDWEIARAKKEAKKIAPLE